MPKQESKKECKPNNHKVKYDKVNNVYYCVKCRAVIEDCNW